MMNNVITGQAVDDVEAVQSMGLLDLDPEGVTLLGGKFAGSIVIVY